MSSNCGPFPLMSSRGKRDCGSVSFLTGALDSNRTCLLHVPKSWITFFLSCASKWVLTLNLCDLLPRYCSPTLGTGAAASLAHSVIPDFRSSEIDPEPDSAHFKLVSYSRTKLMRTKNDLLRNTAAISSNIKSTLGRMQLLKLSAWKLQQGHSNRKRKHCSRLKKKNC